MQENYFKIDISDIRISTVWYDNRFNVSESTISEENAYDFGKTHSHTSYEIFFVTQGKLWLVTENESILCENSMVIIPPNMCHYTVTEKAVISVIFFKIEKHEEKSARIYNKFIEKITNTPLVLHLNSDIFHTVSRIAREQDDTPGAHALLGHLVSVLFTDVFNIIAPSPKQKSSHPKRFYAHSINMFLSNNYTRKLSLSDLAEELFLSEKQTSRIIHNNFNCSFPELITQFRLNVACMALSHTDNEISQIAASVGYEYPNLFYAHFKKLLGTTPAEYRKKNRLRK